jgi:hypothetical protein
MAFVITTSLFFAAVDIVLLKFLIYLGKFRRALSPRIERWIQDGVLQLQRRAYEAHGEGIWSDLSKEVPLTEAKQLLAELPLESLPPAKRAPVPAPPNGTQPAHAQPPQQPSAAPSTQLQGSATPIPTAQATSTQIPSSANAGALNSVAPSAGANGPQQPTQRAASITPVVSTQTQQTVPRSGTVP